MLHLEHTATLLQKIHFPEYMRGYKLFLHPDGVWQARDSKALATVFVSPKTIELTVHHSSISTSIPVEIDRSLKIEQSIQILYRNWTYTLSLFTTAPPWWPYLGKISIPPRLARHSFNQDIHIGRKEGSTIKLPSDGYCDNIIWNDGLTLVDTIPTPSGQIPKNRFATDMINVSSHHGTFSLIQSNVLLKCESTQCPIFVNRSDEIIILSPNAPNATGISCSVQVGDEVLIGNHCFNIKRLPDKTLKRESSVDALLKPENSAEDTDVAIFGPGTQVASATNSETVIAIAEQDWELSLQSTYRIKVLGWILKGEQHIGNHIDCGVCIPENLSTPQQSFEATVYATAHVRRGTGHIQLVNANEFHCHNPDDELRQQRFSVLRRSPSGNIDFQIPLSLSSNSPVPGGLFLQLDHREETTSAMFHVGLYEDLTQVIQLCQHTCTTKLTGQTLRIIAPDNVRLMQQRDKKWQVSQSPYIELQTNELAIIDSLIIQFIHEDITVID